MVGKKIFIVRTGLGQGGADRVTLNLLQNLPEDNNEYILVLMQKKGELIPAVPDRFEIIDLKAPHLSLMVFPLIRKIVQYKPDIIFSTSGGTNIVCIIASWFSFSKKIRVIISERNILNIGKPGLKRKLLNSLKKNLYKYASEITAVSEGVKEDLIHSLALASKNVIVLKNPLISDSISGLMEEPVDHPWFNNNCRVVLAVGRLVYQKDYPTLFKAFQIVIKQIPNAKLFILGEGEEMDKLKLLAKQLNLPDKIYFAGFVTNAYKYMHKCDLYVLSSKNEGMPGSLIQAMACGAPCIATNCPSGPSELIYKNQSNGILVNVGDCEQMAEEIIKLLSDRSLAETISNNGKSSVMDYRISYAIPQYLKAIFG
jgi:glycosyltransferase involved in cell wall biosynthesis